MTQAFADLDRYSTFHFEIATTEIPTLPPIVRSSLALSLGDGQDWVPSVCVGASSEWVRTVGTQSVKPSSYILDIID
jgi:hypothetical protein